MSTSRYPTSPVNPYHTTDNRPDEAGGWSAEASRAAGQPVAPSPAHVNLPGWQSAFALASNVRFSRTPESELQKRRGVAEQPKDTYAARRAAEKAAEIERAEAARRAAAESLMARHVQTLVSQPLAEFNPVEAQAEAVQPALTPAMTPAMLQDMARVGLNAQTFAPIDAEAPVDAFVLPAFLPVAKGPEVAAQVAPQAPVSVPDWVSDFAFFETMDQGAALAPEASSPVVAAPVGNVFAPFFTVPKPSVTTQP